MILFFCGTQRTRHSAAIDEAERDQQTSEAEVCPDLEDSAIVDDTSSTNPEGMLIQCGNG